MDPDLIPVRSRPSTGRHSVDVQRPGPSIGSNSVDLPARPRPSTSRNSVDLPVRSRPSSSAVRRCVRDYSHVPVDAIDSDSLESGDEKLSGESSGSDEDIGPSRQRQSRQAQYPLTGR